jgi:hypothetical protein
MWRKNLELTKDVTSVYITREMKRASLHNAHVSRVHQACPETWAMVNAVYGLTQEDEKKYISLLSQVNSLPCIVDFSPLANAAKIDGVCNDVSEPLIEDENMPIESTPDVDDAAFIASMQALLASPSVTSWCSECHRKVCCCHKGPPGVPDMSADDSEDCVELTPFLHPSDA